MTRPSSTSGKESPTKSAKPQFAPRFDPYNSTSGGHQRCDLRPGTGWRDSRNRKLNSQFRGGSSGGKRLSDTHGPGSSAWDEELKAIVPKSLRDMKGHTVMDMLMKSGKKQNGLQQASRRPPQETLSKTKDRAAKSEDLENEDPQETCAENQGTRKRGIFDGVIAYVNGSTYPLISDHRLKHIFSEHGGQVSLHLTRRQVTHVVLGRPSQSTKSGAGGGLAGGKLDGEIRKTHGASVQYVGAEWILESLKAGKRLPEAEFTNLKIATRRQESVYNGRSSKHRPISAETRPR